MTCEPETIQTATALGPCIILAIVAVALNGWRWWRTMQGIGGPF